MTPSQLATLRAEVTNDPIGLGYSAHLPDSPGMVVELLNAPTQECVQMIPAAIAFSWAATGPYAKIVDAANNVQHPCRAACLALRDALLARLDVHLEIPAIQSLLAALVTTGVLAQSDQDALIAIATQPASRAKVLGLPPVVESDL